MQADSGKLDIRDCWVMIACDRISPWFPFRTIDVYTPALDVSGRLVTVLAGSFSIRSFELRAKDSCKDVPFEPIASRQGYSVPLFLKLFERILHTLLQVACSNPLLAITNSLMTNAVNSIVCINASATIYRSPQRGWLIVAA